jgi:hypothetical protein
MNQKKVKSLRRALNYKNDGKEKEEREYRTFVSSTKKKKIYQFDAAGNINIVERMQDCYQTECVSGGRKLYKEMKKRLSQYGYEGSELMEMPSDDAVNELVQAAKAEMKEEENE